MPSALLFNPLVQYRFDCIQKVVEEDVVFDRFNDVCSMEEQSDLNATFIVKGNIYTGEQHHEAMFIQNGIVEAIGNYWSVLQLAKDTGFAKELNTIELAETECVVPGFVLPRMDWLAGLATHSWIHLGPFGLQANWQHPMPNYNLNYIGKAISYYEKSLPANQWLIGYGLDAELLPYTPFDNTDTEEHLINFLDSLAVQRPICIFEKHGNVAYVNSLAATALYLTLDDAERARYPNIRLFLRFLEQNRGLRSRQFSWLAKVIPADQLNLSFQSVHELSQNYAFEAIKQGITAIGVRADESLLSLVNHSAKPLKVCKTLLQEDTSTVPTCLMGTSIAYPDEIGFDGYNLSRGGDKLNTATLFPYRTIIKQSPMMAFSCEFPERPLGALRLLNHAVNREMLTAPGYVGIAQRKLHPEEALPLSSALACITTNAARCLESANQFGALQAGGAADFVVLSENPFIHSVKLDEVHVNQTWVDGKCVYESVIS